MEKIVFQSTYKGLSILMTPQNKIEFRNHLYSTSDPKEAEFLRDHRGVWEVQGEPTILADVADPELKTAIPVPRYATKAKMERKQAKASPVVSPVPVPEYAPKLTKKGGKGRK